MTRRLRIVIADDEVDIRQGFRRLLTKLGCDVIGEASNGQELIDLCEETSPDLVITDIRMPGLSGIEAANKLANTTPVPVIVVSSHESPNVEKSSVIAAVLQKPVGLPELEQAIARACPEDEGLRPSS